MPVNKNTVYFARTNFRGENKIFGLKAADRRQHTYVIGKTGTGKSALIKNLAIQDINSGQGLCFVDPHGETVEEILQKIPNSRSKDVIYFNPADLDYPLGFNVLEVPDIRYKHLVAQGLLGIFTKIWANVWSPRMEYILQNCILALVETPGTTLLGIQRILTDRDYRQKILANVTDPVVRAFWLNEYEVWEPRFRNEAIVPIQNKVGQFLSTSLIRNIVGQRKSSFDFFELMNQGKILLVNISKGRIGEENSALLGAMIITKVQLSAMERVRIPEEDRKDFYLYVDEFQNFATEAFAGILSEARKYRLNLIIAHQYIGQLVTETSTRVRDAVFGNVGTMIFFRVGATDAEFLEKEVQPEFVIDDLVDLPNYNIYLKLMVNGLSSRPFSATTLPPLATTGDMAASEEVINSSRKDYARPVSEVEAEIKKWASSLPGETEFEGEKISATSPQVGIIAKGMQPKSEKFEVPCWICQKLATLPFKPDGIRPVYCSDCLKKIESGQLRPLRPLPSEKRGREFEGGLEALGIEFAGKETRSPIKERRPEVGFNRVTPEKRTFSMRPLRQRPFEERGPVVRVPVPGKTLSLEELKAKAWQGIKKDKKTQINELREALKETLKGEKDSPSALTSDSQPKEIGIKAKGQVLKPGDKIKFGLFIFAFILPTLVFASNHIASFEFVTSGQSIEPNVVSEKITVQFQDGNGNPVSAGQTSCLSLVSGSVSGEFSSSADNWSPVNVLTINSNWTSRSFYYRDPSEGVHAITARVSMKPADEPRSCSNWPQDEWGIDWTAEQQIAVGQVALSEEPDESQSHGSIVYADNQQQTVSSPGKNYVAKIIGSEVAIVGATLSFEGLVSDSSGKPISASDYLWSFGDGTTMRGRFASHTYAFPGQYVIFFNAALFSSSLSDSLTINAIPNEIKISEVKPGIVGWVEIFNDSDFRLDISHWALSNGNDAFYFPKNTFMGAKTYLVITNEISGIEFLPSGSAFLLYPRGKVAHEFSYAGILKADESFHNVNGEVRVGVESPASGRFVSRISVPSSRTSQSDREPVPVKPLSDSVSAEIEEPEEPSEIQLAAVAEAKEPAQNGFVNSVWMWFGVALALGILSAAGYLFVVRRGSPR